jgi:hypothetical protein
MYACIHIYVYADLLTERLGDYLRMGVIEELNYKGALDIFKGSRKFLF